MGIACDRSSHPQSDHSLLIRRILQHTLPVLERTEGGGAVHVIAETALGLATPSEIAAGRVAGVGLLVGGEED